MATTTNFGWETPDDTDLVKDGAAAIRTLGSAIDTSLVDLKGGTTGQVLAKASNTDMDFTWATDASGIPATIFDAKGDLIAASAADTAARLGVGTNGQYLSADSSTATGLKWVTPAGGGKVLQVVTATTTTSKMITSTTNTDSNITASITPIATSSKILILITASTMISRTNVGGPSSIFTGGRVMRDATAIYDMGSTGMSGFQVPPSNYALFLNSILSITYLDSPSTTSSTTYKLQGRVEVDGTLYFQNTSIPGSITLLEIGA